MPTTEKTVTQNRPSRTRTTSVNEPATTSAPKDEEMAGEIFLDVLCVKHSGKSAGLTIYKDRLRTNIIGELSLKEF